MEDEGQHQVSIPMACISTSKSTTIEFNGEELGMARGPHFEDYHRLREGNHACLAAMEAIDNLT